MSLSISLIAALARNRTIGVNNGLPWRLPADLKRFRALTVGKPVLMGRKTFESIGKPLSDRTNIVLTHKDRFIFPGTIVVHSLQEALTAAAKNGEEIMVIGGASLYAQTLPHAQRLYLTKIHQDFMGDAYFPALDPEEWQEIARDDHFIGNVNPYSYSFLVLEKKAPSDTQTLTINS